MVPERLSRFEPAGIFHLSVAAMGSTSHKRSLLRSRRCFNQGDACIPVAYSVRGDASSQKSPSFGIHSVRGDVRLTSEAGPERVTRNGDPFSFFSARTLSATLVVRTHSRRQTPRNVFGAESLAARDFRSGRTAVFSRGRLRGRRPASHLLRLYRALFGDWCFGRGRRT